MRALHLERAITHLLAGRSACTAVMTIAVLAILSLVAARAQTTRAASTPAPEQFVCLSGAVQRLIVIHRAGDERTEHGCHVDYTRDGQTRTLWAADHDYAYCVRRAVELVTRLQQENFTCKPETTDSVEPGASSADAAESPSGK